VISLYEKQKRPNILIVDDEPHNINLLNGLLRDDYNIQVATTGQQAIHIAKETQPDLILLDIMLPDLNGYAVCRQLKSNDITHSIPIIFITVRSNAEEETLGFDLGAVDFISKPFNNAIVLARVKTHIHLKQKSDLLESLSAIDALTEIPNRRALDQIQEKEWSRGCRSNMPLSFAMIDIDLFKAYNDNYGHSKGDDVIIKVAQALNQTVQRSGDFIARYGGEEFCAILANTDFDGALTIAERFHQAIKALDITHAYNSNGNNISISIGIACTQPSKDNSAKQLIQLADEMLYKAKTEGRNQTQGKMLDLMKTNSDD